MVQLWAVGKDASEQAQSGVPISTPRHAHKTGWRPGDFPWQKINTTTWEPLRGVATKSAACSAASPPSCLAAHTGSPEYWVGWLGCCAGSQGWQHTPCHAPHSQPWTQGSSACLHHMPRWPTVPGVQATSCTPTCGVAFCLSCPHFLRHVAQGGLRSSPLAQLAG